MQTDEKQEEMKHVSLHQIVKNPFQPRRDFKPDELDELAQSILAVGFIHPPLVRPLPNSDLYELISGERRLRAAELLQLPTIPVFVRHAYSTLSAQAALIENIQRVDLNPLEIAKALKRLMEEFSLNQDLLAAKIGKKRSTVANYLRLLNLPHSLQESIQKGFISMGHAKAILSLNEEKKQLLLHELILREGLNVRETEAAAHRIGEKAKKQELKPANNRDVFLEHLEQKMREKLGTQVTVHPQGKKGRLVIDYYSSEDLERLIHLLGIQKEI
jgi:ParB family chromosome partitioning protein